MTHYSTLTSKIDTTKWPGIFALLMGEEQALPELLDLRTSTSPLYSLGSSKIATASFVYRQAQPPNSKDAAEKKVVVRMGLVWQQYAL